MRTPDAANDPVNEVDENGLFWTPRQVSICTGASLSFAFGIGASAGTATCYVATTTGVAKTGQFSTAITSGLGGDAVGSLSLRLGAEGDISKLAGCSITTTASGGAGIGGFIAADQGCNGEPVSSLTIGATGGFGAEGSLSAGTTVTKLLASESWDGILNDVAGSFDDLVSEDWALVNELVGQPGQSEDNGPGNWGVCTPLR